MKVLIKPLKSGTLTCCTYKFYVDAYKNSRNIKSGALYFFVLSIMFIIFLTIIYNKDYIEKPY